MIRKFAFVAVLVCVPSLLFGQAAGSKAPVVKKGTAPVTKSSDGQEMYVSYCAPCHGRSGKGDGPAAAALTPKPSDLTQFAKKYGRNGAFPSKDFEDKLNGMANIPAHGSSDMPVWGPILRHMGNNELRFYNIREYVKGLQAQAN